MTVETPQSIEFAEERAELKTVLESKGFARAPTLANLLSYLCEKVFAGEANQIKEYSIAVEAFRRSDSFDQDSDSIVRVEANRLRKRLAEYYRGEGAQNRLQISIPVGQYVPKFNVIVSPPSPDPPESAAATSGDPNPASAQSSQATLFRRWWWVAAAVVVLCGVAAALLARHSLWQRQQQPAIAANPPSEGPSEPPLGPPGGEEVRILAGAGRSFVDHADKLWSGDEFFTGGTAVKSSIEHIARTLNPGFYRTSRQGAFRYDIPLRPGIYELHLHFAETVYGPESSGSGGEGSRIMNIRANGVTLLSQFDVVADAGASSTADVKVFTGIEPARDGKLHLEFSADNGQQAILSAIEILPGIRGHVRPIRILARESPYYSNDSHWWSPDDYFEGGQLAAYTAPVKGTDDPELYETERWGNFSYAVPVAPGKYTVTLYFAARHGNWDEPSADAFEGKPTVAHVFNVFCNGQVLLSAFDLAKEAHDSDVVIRRFAGLEPNAQGKLNLGFVPVRGYASVTGVEVLPQ
ncbi:MAG TPA: malectin domain-containing carbohydrate-binding protein [Terracidiphilus sp.]